ncbi:SDR family oxidoreductase [Niabella aurantiaca]|uniref:SDR family oxidoreductase n=1 Tax=Niabella aurantiaca TaxID=379900 RepID=UPI00036B4202|nr:SDR family oxidoreductase [Niabella aurantiaca]
MSKILLAGATGYLGGFILKELLRKGFETKALVRNEKKLPEGCLAHPKLELIKAEITNRDALKDCCRDIDVVISTVGITRQKDGLTYMDVDYQANLNLLEEAKRNGVEKFIYISVLNGEKLTHLKICEAKEKFVWALKNSGLDYCIIRPTGYFSDMGEFFEMAKKGRIYLFGNGEHRMNPIHGADLAAVCVNAVVSGEKEILAGGPEILSHNQMAETAFSIAVKKPKITHIPNWLTKSLLFLIRTCTGSKTYGPIEFFITVLSRDMIAPEYGNHTLKEYFKEIKLHNQFKS